MRNCRHFYFWLSGGLGSAKGGRMCVTVSNCRHFGTPDVQKCVMVVIFESGLCQRRAHVCNCHQFGAPDVRKCVTIVIFEGGLCQGKPQF